MVGTCHLELSEVPVAKEAVLESLKSNKWEWIAKLLGRNIPQLLNLIHILQKVAALEGELLALIGSEQSAFKKAVILIKWCLHVIMGRNGEDQQAKKVEALFVSHVLLCAGGEHLVALKGQEE